MTGVVASIGLTLRHKDTKKSKDLNPQSLYHAEPQSRKEGFDTLKPFLLV